MFYKYNNYSSYFKGVAVKSVVKIDINFFNKPLYFQNLKYSIEKKFVWTDIDGFEYHSSYIPPDYVDAMILFYFLLRSQSEGYAEKIFLTRYEIIKNCGFSVCPKTYDRIENSLERWSAVYIKFEGTFYDNQEYLTKFFHILKGSVNKKTQKVEVVFDPDWLLKIKESNFFKYLNFNYYKSLKKPISRRLYELLSTKCYDGNEWHIRLTNLGNDLPIAKRKVHTKEGEKDVMYASDVLVAIKPGFNEINALANDKDVVKIAKALPGDIFTVQYRITGKDQERVIHIKTNRVKLTENKPDNHVAAVRQSVNIQPQSSSCQNPEQANEGLEELLNLLKKRSHKTEKVVADYYQTKGTEYVKANILYVNQKSTKSYSGYLQNALRENWAGDWADEEKTKTQKEVKRSEQQRVELAEDTKKAELKKLGEQQRPAFCQAVQSLDDNVKQELWTLAEKNTPTDNVRRNMAIKLNYIKILVEYLNNNGHDFVEQVSNFDLAKSLAWQEDK